MEFEYAGHGHTLGVGYYDHAETALAEIFIDTHKNGTALAANARDGAVVASIAIQHGASPAELHAALNRQGKQDLDGVEGGEPPGVIGAALDRLKSARPDLFVTAPVEAPSPTLAPIIDSDLNREIDAEIDRIRAEQEADPVDVALLRAENAALHDQVAAQADEIRALKDQLADRGETRSARQTAVIDLAASIWGQAAVWNKNERVRRFWEECCEAVQAFGMSADEATCIQEVVFSRPCGEPEQEMGGVSFTHLCLCAAFGMDAEELEIREIERVRAKDPETMRQRHQQKVDAGIAMQARPPQSKESE